MPEPVKKKVKVLQAEYIEEVDSIIMVGQCQEGKFRQQIHSSSFSFGDKNKEVEMKKLAELLVGKNIFMVFDEDLDDKIQDNAPLKY